MSMHKVVGWRRHTGCSRNVFFFLTHLSELFVSEIEFGKSIHFFYFPLNIYNIRWMLCYQKLNIIHTQGLETKHPWKCSSQRIISTWYFEIFNFFTWNWCAILLTQICVFEVNGSNDNSNSFNFVIKDLKKIVLTFFQSKKNTI